MTVPSPAHILDHALPDYDEQEVTLRGSLPSWLRGSLIRTAAACFAQGSWRAAHLFDALCAVYAFDFREDGSVRYRARVLESDLRRRLREGLDDTPHFFTGMRRKTLARLLSPIPRINDNTNVNVLPFADELIAMTETNVQHSIDRATLSTRGFVRYDDEHHQKLFMLAHPRLDRARGVIANVATAIGGSPAIVLYEHDIRERKRRIVARIPFRELPYLHSFGLTPRHAVLFAGPLLLAPWRLLWSDRGFIRHFRYRPERGSRIYCVDRGSGEVRTHRAPAAFVFHVINAFERGDETVLDALTYDDPAIIDTLTVDALRARWPEFDGKPVRYVLRRGREEAVVEPLSEQRFEFPALHEQLGEGRAHRYVWGASGAHESGGYRSAIVQLDRERAHAKRFEEDGFVFGEPLFVPKPDARDERDGVLISVAPHLTEARSVLAVLDAETLDVRGWGELEQPIPFSFHGCFLTEGASSPHARQA